MTEIPASPPPPAAIDSGHGGLRLGLRHATRFLYDGPATDSSNTVRLCPWSDALQDCESFTLRLDPPASVLTYRDFYSNRVDHFEIPEPHERLEIVADSLVTTRPDPRGPAPSGVSLSSLDDPAVTENFFDFLTDSSYVSLDAEVWREGVDALPDGVQGLWEAAVIIGAHIHRTFAYAPRTTHAATPMIEALRGRCGVCQDFAHIMLAICRTQGIPARYVSGYFFNPDRRPDEIEASHAWVEVFLPGYGWAGYDPTHDRPADTRYVKIAAGRDYSDIRPVHGIFRGRGTREMTVEVKLTMRALGAPPSPGGPMD